MGSEEISSIIRRTVLEVLANRSHLPPKKRLLRLSKVTPETVPLSRHTLHAWRHRGKHPELFIKFGSGVYLDLDALDNLLEENRGRKQDLKWGDE